MRWTMATLGLAAALAGGAARAEEAGFKDWWVVCDNVLDCGAYGFASEGADAMGFIRIQQGGGFEDLPRVTLGALNSTAKSWRVEIDGKPIRGDATVPLEAAEDADVAVVTLDASKAAAVLDGVRHGRVLTLVGGDEPGPQISLAGGSAALRWIDDRQKRAGTRAALVAKGDLMMTARPPEAPLVRPAPAVDQSKLPKRLPASVAGLRGECDPDLDLDDEMWSPEVHRLAPGRLLWIVSCSRGAYNITADLFTTDEAGGDARAERVPHGEGTESSLMNLSYDPKTRVLTNFDKGRGVGDCGAMNEWAWTGRRFERSNGTLMTECRGVPADLWPTTFVSRDR